MSRYEHSADLAWKTDCEGGVTEMIWGYGLKMEDLPNDMPPPVRACIKRLLDPQLVEDIEEVERYLEKAKEDYTYRDY